MQYDTNDLHARQHSGAVVAATTAVAESIRTGSADLPACPDDLAAVGVTCKGT